MRNLTRKLDDKLNKKLENKLDDITSDLATKFHVRLNNKISCQTWRQPTTNSDQRQTTTNDKQRPLQYHSTIKQLIPDLDEQDRFSLTSTKIPTLKQVILYSTTADDEAAGYFKFSELYDMPDSNHLNQAKNIKVE